MALNWVKIQYERRFTWPALPLAPRPPQRLLEVQMLMILGSAPKISGAAALQLKTAAGLLWTADRWRRGCSSGSHFLPCWPLLLLLLLLLLHLFGGVTVTPSSPVSRWESRSRRVLPGVAGGGLKAAERCHSMLLLLLLLLFHSRPDRSAQFCTMQVNLSEGPEFGIISSSDM